MSILIKDMEMPNACWACEGCDGDKKNGYFCILHKDAYDLVDIDIFKEKPDWCPLIEIPTPHGRLVDENELCNKIMSEFRGVCSYDVSPSEAESDFMSIVDSCKTIVKAENDL